MLVDAVTVRFDGAAGADIPVPGGSTVNVTKGATVECVQVGENMSWAGPVGQLLGTVKVSENAPVLLMAAVASVVPQPLTLIDEQPVQSVANAVTGVPGGPCVGDTVGVLSSALAGSACAVRTTTQATTAGIITRRTLTIRDIAPPPFRPRTNWPRAEVRLEYPTRYAQGWLES